MPPVSISETRDSNITAACPSRSMRKVMCKPCCSVDKWEGLRCSLRVDASAARVHVGIRASVRKKNIQECPDR